MPPAKVHQLIPNRTDNNLGPSTNAFENNIFSLEYKKATKTKPNAVTDLKTKCVNMPSSVSFLLAWDLMTEQLVVSR